MIYHLTRISLTQVCLGLASAATFQLVIKKKKKKPGSSALALPGSLVSAQDNRPRDRSETSRGLAALPGPQSYDRSNCMDGAMFQICQNRCAQTAVVKRLRHSGQYQLNGGRTLRCACLAMWFESSL